jgi:hypothetical protein
LRTDRLQLKNIIADACHLDCPDFAQNFQICHDHRPAKQGRKPAARNDNYLFFSCS